MFPQQLQWHVTAENLHVAVSVPLNKAAVAVSGSEWGKKAIVHRETLLFTNALASLFAPKQAASFYLLWASCYREVMRKKEVNYNIHDFERLPAVLVSKILLKLLTPMIVSYFIVTIVNS